MCIVLCTVCSRSLFIVHLNARVCFFLIFICYSATLGCQSLINLLSLIVKCVTLQVDVTGRLLFLERKRVISLCCIWLCWRYLLCGQDVTGEAYQISTYSRRSSSDSYTGGTVVSYTPAQSDFTKTLASKTVQVSLCFLFSYYLSASCSSLVSWCSTEFVIKCLSTSQSTVCQSLTLWHDSICGQPVVDRAAVPAGHVWPTYFLCGWSVSDILRFPNIGRDSFQMSVNFAPVSKYWSIQCNRGSTIMCYEHWHFTYFANWLYV